MAPSQKCKLQSLTRFSEPLIDREEWSTFAPSFMKIAAQGPGIAPAQAMVEKTNQLVSFSTAALVVDMGCGPGQITDAVLQKHPAGLLPTAGILGVDNSPQMLAQYAARKEKELNEGKEYWGRVKTARMDIHDCAELTDDSVTHMLAGFVVFLVPEPVKAVEAMKSKLVSGGVLAFSAWESSDWQELMYYPKKVRPDLVMPSPPVDWTQPDGVRKNLHKIGFSKIQVEQTEGYWSFTDHDEICRFILTKMPLAARVISQMSDEEVFQTHALMVSALKAKYPSVPARMISENDTLDALISDTLNMGLHSELPVGLEEVDIIVVGGGTAGCVVAARLSDADPNLSILVLESGPNNHNAPEVVHLGLYRANFAPDKPNFQYWPAVEEKQLAGRSVALMTGSMLGGGSSVNGAIYARAQQRDFDEWNMKGWSGDDLLPFMKKLEAYHGEDGSGSHGHNGPVKVSGGLYRGDEIQKDFLSALLQAGYPTVEDVHDLQAVNAGSPSRRYISMEDGRRQDSAHAYLHPRLQDGQHPNLHVLVGVQVTRILFDAQKKATAVEFKSNPRVAASVDDSRTTSVTARKLVVLSAGVFGTSTLLERSGIGNKEILDRAHVPLIHHLPGVGQNFQDHQSGLYVYQSRLPVKDTWESIYNGDRDPVQMIATSDKILSWNGVDAAAKLRPTESDVSSLGPQFQEFWATEYQKDQQKPLAGLILVNGILGDPTPFPNGASYFTLCSYTSYPLSRGSVHITGSNIDDLVEFKSGYLLDTRGMDLKAHVWAYKKQREVARKMALFGGEIGSEHPAFPAGTPASEGAGYSAEDDKLIEEFLRTKVGTTWHPLGTCKMAPHGESKGVVDGSLKVYGVDNLRIADLSIAPGNVAANTMSTALLIGEKAADIFIREVLHGQ